MGAQGDQSFSHCRPCLSGLGQGSGVEPGVCAWRSDASGQLRALWETLGVLDGRSEPSSEPCSLCGASPTARSWSVTPATFRGRVRR